MTPDPFALIFLAVSFISSKKKQQTQHLLKKKRNQSQYALFSVLFCFLFKLTATCTPGKKVIPLMLLSIPWWCWLPLSWAVACLPAFTPQQAGTYFALAKGLMEQLRDVSLCSKYVKYWLSSAVAWGLSHLQKTWEVFCCSFWRSLLQYPECWPVMCNLLCNVSHYI